MVPVFGGMTTIKSNCGINTLKAVVINCMYFDSTKYVESASNRTFPQTGAYLHPTERIQILEFWTSGHSQVF